MKKQLRIGLGLVLLLVLAACAQPLPEERQDYVGLWKGEKITLLIDRGGYVEYERVEKNGSSSSTKSVNAPLKEFDGDDFIVGVAFLSTTFEVSEAPNLQDGVWQMVVDGERLTKVE